MNERDVGYYRQRAINERQRAQRAVDPTVARAHRQLAEQYEHLLGEHSASLQLADC